MTARMGGNIGIDRIAVLLDHRKSKLDGRPVLKPKSPGAAIPDQLFGDPTPQTRSDGSLVISRIFVYTFTALRTIVRY